LTDHNDADATTYARLCGFDGDWRDSWWNQDFLELLARRWRLSEGHRVLDVGCGAGHWGLRLLPLCAPTATMHGVDREAGFLDAARARAAARDLGERCTFSEAHGERLPFDDGSFDVVTCQTVLMHVDDPEALLAEMHRVLAPGGVLIAAEPDNTSNVVAEARGYPRMPEGQLFGRLELALTCHAGKLALGHGDDDIGPMLPGMFGDLGLTDLRCYLNDNATIVVSPYGSRQDRSDPEETRRRVEHDLRDLHDLFASRYLAGNDSMVGFRELWDNLVDTRIAQEEAKQRRATAGGHLHYVMSGRKPA
jgi:SAM-dependent methyltransferase